MTKEGRRDSEARKEFRVTQQPRNTTEKGEKNEGGK